MKGRRTTTRRSGRSKGLWHTSTCDSDGPRRRAAPTADGPPNEALEPVATCRVYRLRLQNSRSSGRARTGDTFVIKMFNLAQRDGLVYSK